MTVSFGSCEEIKARRCKVHQEDPKSDPVRVVAIAADEEGQPPDSSTIEPAATGVLAAVTGSVAIKKAPNMVDPKKSG